MTSPDRPGLRARSDRLDVERACATAFDPVTGHLSSRAMAEHLRAHASSGDVPLALIVASVPPRDLPTSLGRFRGLDLLDRTLTSTVARHARRLGGVVATVDDGAAAIAVHGEDPARLAGVVGRLRAELDADGTLPRTQVTQATGTAREGPALLVRELVARGADDRPDGGHGHPAALDVTDLLMSHPGTVLPLPFSAEAPLHVAVRSRALAERPALAGGIRRLRESGAHVSLIGYGSGRAPYDSLDELPVDALELDHALLRGSRVSRADRAVLWSITSLARRYGLPLLSRDVVGPAGPVGIPDNRWDRLGERARAHLEDAWDAGLTPVETSLLLNAGHERTADGRRWTRYDVALAWSSVF
jgi:hypothetical protein